MQKIVDFIKQTFNTQEFIPLHEPRFIGNEKKYLNDCIDSTFVSSVGKYVDTFEKEFAKTVGSKYAIATVNGTAALHISLILADVKRDDEVITQPLTFIATCNAISYIGAKPIFVDVDLDTMGLSPNSLKSFLEQNCEVKENICINKTTGQTIKACVPMHTFGHPCKIDEIKNICDEWNITLVEDAAESLGSFYKDKHTGTVGKIGAFSFNGNKIITSGGELDTKLAADLIEKIDTSDRVEKEEAIIPPYEEISMPKREFIVPPYWNKVAKTGDELDKELIFSWINHRVLFRQRWGYKRGKQTPEAFMKYEKDVVEPLYYSLKDELISKNIFEPIAIYE